MLDLNLALEFELEKCLFLFYLPVPIHKTIF